MTDTSAYSGQNAPQESAPVYPEQPLPPPAVSTPVYEPSQSPAQPAAAPQTELYEAELGSEFAEVTNTQPSAPAPQVSETFQQTPLQQPVAPRAGAPTDFDDNRPQPEEVVAEWTAPARPFKKRNRQYYTTVCVIVFLICMILFVAGQFLPIAVVIAVAFMAYVLSAVPPEVVLNRITTYGIRTDDSLYYWDELGRFWFDEKFHQRLLHIECSRFPNQITLVLNDVSEEELQDLLGAVLLNERPALNSFNKAAQWLQEKIPLDTEA